MSECLCAGRVRGMSKPSASSKKCPTTHGTQLKNHWTLLVRTMALSPEQGQNLIHAI